MPKGKRHNGKEFRKHLVYQISTNQLLNKRRKPSELEVQTLLTAIDKNQISLFGVEKLSVLDLDNIYNISPDNEPQYKVLNESDGDSDTCSNRVTLLEYAMLLSRDHIICALYKAGANPFISACQRTCCVTLRDTSTTKPILSRLKLRPYQNIIWIFRVIDALSSHSTQANECMLHTNCHTHTKLCDTTSQTSHNICSITFPSCQHTISKLCFWLAFIDMDPLCDICCPICHTELTSYPLNKHSPKNNRHNKYTSNLISCNSNSTNLDQATTDMSSLTLHLETNSDTTTDTTTASLLSSTKGDSYMRWAQLPNSSELLPIPARPSFMAHSLTELAGLYLGEVSTVHICLLHASFDISMLAYVLRYMHVIIVSSKPLGCLASCNQSQSYQAGNCSISSWH